MAFLETIGEGVEFICQMFEVIPEYATAVVVWYSFLVRVRV